MQTAKNEDKGGSGRNEDDMPPAEKDKIINTIMHCVDSDRDGRVKEEEIRAFYGVKAGEKGPAWAPEFFGAVSANKDSVELTGESIRAGWGAATKLLKANPKMMAGLSAPFEKCQPPK